MNRLTQRIERLERRLRLAAATAPCRVCGGEGRLCVRMDDDEAPPVPCHCCGKVLLVVIRDVEVPIDRSAVLESEHAWDAP
jgi:hypothetical protein